MLSTFAGLAAAEVVTGLYRGASSPILPVGQEVIDATPRSVRQWAIDTFGTADKAVLVLGTLFSLAVIGSIVGILAVKGRIVAAYTVTVVVGLIGVWAVLERPAPTFGKLLPPIVGTLVSLGGALVISPDARSSSNVALPLDADADRRPPTGVERRAGSCRRRRRSG